MVFLREAGDNVDGDIAGMLPYDVFVGQFVEAGDHRSEGCCVLWVSGTRQCQLRKEADLRLRMNSADE
jgi:hypothetical protein